MNIPKVFFPERIPDFIQTGQYEECRPLNVLQKDFEVFINGNLFIIPDGVITDLGSIPRLFWNIFLPGDPDSVAAYLLHDVAYVAELWPRKYADSLLLGAMKFLGSKGKHLKYYAVRMGGGFTYKKHTEHRIHTMRLLLKIDSMKRPLCKSGNIPIRYS